MRIKITLKTLNRNELYIPYRYNYILSSFIYNNLKDSNFATNLHNSTSFKFFTFAQLYMHNFKHKPHKNGFIVPEGYISLIISSPSSEFVNNLIYGITTSKDLFLFKKNMELIKVETFDEPELNEIQDYYTLSPIIVRKPYMKGGKLKAWDLNPSDNDFFKGLEENLIKKYTKFTGEEFTDTIKINTGMRSVKGLKIGIESGRNIIYSRCYMLDLHVKAPVYLQRFLYNVGAGEKTSMGFGCLKLF